MGVRRSEPGAKRTKFGMTLEQSAKEILARVKGEARMPTRRIVLPDAVGSKRKRTLPSADEIAEKGSRGEKISAYFTNKFTVVKPVRRVNVDLTQGMLREIDERAARLNVSRQAVIKTLLDRALEERAGKPRPRRKAG